MGFFSKPDPLAKAKAELEARPKDVKLLQDIAGMLKAKGQVDDAAEHYMRAARAQLELGFAPKAIALAKQVSQMLPKSPEAFEFLIEQYEEGKLKEELRSVLKTLLGIYRGNGSEAAARATEAKLDALGPGR
jgi:tetratricopeptide (TPR) repeat protein